MSAESASEGVPGSSCRVEKAFATVTEPLGEDELPAGTGAAAELDVSSTDCSTPKLDSNSGK